MGPRGAAIHTDHSGVYDIEGVTGFGQFGVDYVVNRRLRVGFMAHGDSITKTGGGAETEGWGFLAGPYAVLRSNDTFSFEAMALGGQAYDTLTNVVGPADYASDRGVLTGRLSGRLEAGGWWVRPAARGGVYAERRRAFTSSYGAHVAAETVALWEMKFGPQIGYRFQTPLGTIEPLAGVDGVAIYSFEAEDSASDVNGVSATATVGLEADLGLACFSAHAAADGLGDPVQSGFSGAVQFVLPPN